MMGDTQEPRGVNADPTTHLRDPEADHSICGLTLLVPGPLTDDASAATCPVCRAMQGIEDPEYRITRTSIHDLRISPNVIALPAPDLASYLADQIDPQTGDRAYYVILAPRGGELIRYVGTKTAQAPQHAAEAIRDLKYRLAAIERLAEPVATYGGEQFGLFGSAIHEIARGARTPDDAVTLIGPLGAQFLAGLTR